jgi:NAD(P)-dependent dehydrogenase (short-subunit alcohol dehydrogenase family)
MPNAAAGRVALVTGASQGGTGTVAAIRLAAEGAKVAITARSVDGLERTRAEIETLGGTALVLPCDLAARDGGRDTLVARTEAALGPVDILVNNAAAGGYRPLEEWGQDDLDRIMELNLYAPWLLMRQVLPRMRERGQGWVVNLTSFAGELPPGPPYPTNRPAKTGSAYGASKAALNRLTVAAASETEGQGIAVNALTPQAAIAVPSLVARGLDRRDVLRAARHHGAGGARARHLRPGAPPRPHRLQPPAAPRARRAGARPARRARGRGLAARRPPGAHRAPGRHDDGDRRLGRTVHLPAPEQSRLHGVVRSAWKV